MGSVEKTGKGVKRLKVGDRVVVPSTMACGQCYERADAAPRRSCVCATTTCSEQRLTSLAWCSRSFSAPPSLPPRQAAEAS